MRLILPSIDQLTIGQQAKSHSVSLPNDETAVVEAVSRGAWRLTIYRRGTRVDRGLFGSTHDALTLLEAEYFRTAE